MKERPAITALRLAARLSGLLLLAVIAVWLRWTGALLFLGVTVLTFGFNALTLRRRDPGLLRTRLKKDEPVTRFDKIVKVLSIPLAIAVFVVAGMDVLAYGWSTVSPWAIALGVFLHVVGDVPVLWSMISNPFLERMVRIQHERGHEVVTVGPYRYVRHPMYVGILLMLAGWPLILGSLWALVPAAALAALLVFRTAREDAMLQRELAGYAEYATRTRYRLVPGIW